MAIEVPITKEITEYEPNLIGPFTFRQCICIAFCAPSCYFIIKYLSPYITTSVAMYFCFLPAAVAYLFGWAKPYGMRIEKFIKSVFVTRILAPQNRKYKTANTIENILKEAEQEWNSDELAKIMETETRKERKARLKKQKKKYTLSPLAIK